MTWMGGIAVLALSTGASVKAVQSGDRRVFEAAPRLETESPFERTARLAYADFVPLLGEIFSFRCGTDSTAVRLTAVHSLSGDQADVPDRFSVAFEAQSKVSAREITGLHRLHHGAIGEFAVGFDVMEPSPGGYRYVATFSRVNVPESFRHPNLNLG